MTSLPGLATASYSTLPSKLESSVQVFPAGQGCLYRAPVRVTRYAHPKTPSDSSTPPRQRSGLQVHNLFAMYYAVPSTCFASPSCSPCQGHEPPQFATPWHRQHRSAFSSNEKMPLAVFCSQLVVNEHPLGLKLPSSRLAPLCNLRDLFSLLTARHCCQLYQTVHVDAEQPLPVFQPWMITPLERRYPLQPPSSSPKLGGPVARCSATRSFVHLEPPADGSL
jgi:hypothetical protein